MVELKLDVDGEAAFPDCFISVRIGDTQKLSRLTQSRTYNFSQAGDRHYGKIEVYRRVGTCGVDVDPLNEGDRKVNIGCGDLGTLRLNIGVNPKDSKMPPKVAKPADHNDKSSSATAAKEYLRQHSIELQLSEAMQSLLKERPENPVKFLAETLLANIGEGIALPRPPKATKQTPKAGTMQNDAKVAKIAPAPDGTRPVLGRVPYSQYCKTYFVGGCEPAFANLYKKFPGVKRITFTTPSQKAAAKFARTPSVGTWLQLAPKEAPPPPFAKEEPAGGPDPKFVFKPSVGSWLAVKPVTKAPPAQAPPPTTWRRPKQSFVVNSAVFGPTMRLGLAPRMLFI